MPTRPYVLAETTWKTIKSTKYTVAILPWGATEAHNYHLPYGTDNVESDYVATESARIAWEAGAKVIVLPTVPFGVNTGQLDIKLTININPSTQFTLLKDVVDSLSRQGIQKLVVLNSHGGNDFRQMLREIALQYPEMFVCTINWWQINYDNSLNGWSVEEYLQKQTAPPLDTISPSIPDGFSAAAISSSQINLSWSPSTDNIASYLLQSHQEAWPTRSFSKFL